MVEDGGKRRLEDQEKEIGEVEYSSKKSKPTPSNRPRSNRKIQGPGIFVTCVRGRERKAAYELIDIFEELVGKEEERNGITEVEEIVKGETIEDQIDSELQEFRKKAEGKRFKSHKTTLKFIPIFTDLECFFFISVSSPYDPITLTYQVLEDVKRTGIAKSRFVQRLSPVQDTCFADLEDIKNLVERLIKEENLSTLSHSTTFKVEIKMRLHDKVSKVDFIQTLADQMPPDLKAKLHSPTLVLNVEVFRMTVGIGIVRNFDEYRKFNPIMLAEQTQNSQIALNPSSRVKSTGQS